MPLEALRTVAIWEPAPELNEVCIKAKDMECAGQFMRKQMHYLIVPDNDNRCGPLSGGSEPER